MKNRYRQSIADTLQRGTRTETLYEVDMLIDRTLQRAEDGLRLIDEMDRLGFLNMADKSHRQRNQSSDQSEQSNSWGEASFESSSSGIGESISSTHYTIPQLDRPIPPARKRHSSFIKGSKSSACVSDLAMPPVYCDNHKLERTSRTCPNPPLNSPRVSSISATDLISSFKAENRGLYEQIADMRVEVNQLNNEIKTTGQTIRIKFAKRDLKEAFQKRKTNDSTILSLKLKQHADHNAALNSMRTLTQELSKMYQT